MSKEVRGYKVFNQNWTCRDKQYTCPGVFEEDCNPVVCGVGMHFCKKAVDCFKYYRFDPKNKIAEVVSYGEVAESGDKCCTNKLKIVREIPWSELLELVNAGKNCTGFGNSGWYNSGWYNSGDNNSGWYNSGDNNSGWYNSGNWNSGWRNSGWYNSGWYNSGDWNLTNFSNGCFNTKPSKIYLFNKPSSWTLRTWRNSAAFNLLESIPKKSLVWVNETKMTIEEKLKHPEVEITGGYLKEVDETNKRQKWWDNLSDDDKKKILSLPNFDPEIFKKITGIDVEAKDE